jgi:DNA modification methylase
LINKLLLPVFKQAVIHSKDDAAFFIWHASMTKPDFDWAIKAAGLEEKQVIIWIKPSFVLGRADYHWKHEPCIYAQKCGKRARYIGNRDQATVWEIQAGGKEKGEFAIANGLRISQESGLEIYVKKEPPKNVKSRMVRLKQGERVTLTYDDSNTDTWSVNVDSKSTYIHPTQKPLELAARAMKNHTYPGDIVLDLFGGSGSTLIAAEKSERQAYTVEIDERFCDATVKRYAEYCRDSKRACSIRLNGKDMSAAFNIKEKEKLNAKKA